MEKSIILKILTICAAIFLEFNSVSGRGAKTNQPVVWTKLNQTVEILCFTENIPNVHDITECRWKRSSFDHSEVYTIVLNVSKDSISGNANASIENYEFFGNGMANGECGLRIRNINEAQIGKWGCTLVGADIWTGEIEVPLLEKPTIQGINKELLQNIIYKDRNSYAIGECCTTGGKPIENVTLSFEFDGAKISSKLCNNCSTSEKSTCIKRNVRISPDSNGKVLNCSVSHPGFDDGDIRSDFFTLDVKFGPILIPLLNDNNTFVEISNYDNGTFLLRFVVKSNPEPEIILMGNYDKGTEIAATDIPNYHVTNVKNDVYECLIILSNLSKGTFNYTVGISNAYGTNDTNVSIVSPGPGTDPHSAFWIMIIVGIVMSVIFIAIFVIMLNRIAMKKFWCCYKNRGRNYPVARVTRRTVNTNVDVNASTINEYSTVPRVEVLDDSQF